MKTRFAALLFLTMLMLQPAHAANSVVYSSDADQRYPTQDGAIVTVQQVEEAATTICIYHVKNALSNTSPKALRRFSLGRHVLLPSLPLDWEHEQSKGWKNESSSTESIPGYSVGFEAKTADDLVLPGHSIEFRMVFSKSNHSEISNINCNRFDWDIGYAVALTKPEPTTLALSLSNLHLTKTNNIEAQIDLTNVGPNGTKVRIGTFINSTLYADGELKLFARDSAGNIKRLRSYPSPPVSVGGNVEDNITDLLPQKSYVRDLQWYIDLSAGEYTFYVEYTEPGDFWHKGAQGLDECACWTGRTKSNEIKLVVSK